MTNLSRRKFLKKLGMVTAGVTAGSMIGFGNNLAFAQSTCEARKKILVVIHLSGGVHSLSILPPLLLQAYHDQHPNLGITNPLQLTGAVGLHPAMTNFHSIYNGGIPGVGIALFNQVGILDTTGRDVTSRSHDVGTEQYAAALTNPDAGIASGWIGRFAKTYCGGNSAAYNLINLGGIGRTLREAGITSVSASSLAGMTYINDNSNPAALRNVNAASSNKYVRDTIHLLNSLGEPIQNEHDKLFKQTHESAENSVDMLREVVTRYSAPPTGTYLANNPMNQAFMDAAALINSWDLTKVSVIAMAQGGYDTHGAQGNGNLVNGVYQGLSQNLYRLDNAIGGFYKDLMNRNLHQDVAVLVVSEFGRTFENDNKDAAGLPTPGTDHGTGGFAALIGPDIVSQVGYSNYTNEHFTTNNRRWLKAELDIRSVYADVLEHHMGVDPAPIFPEAYVRTNTNIYT